MKRILLILLGCFCLTGCYDYQELNHNYVVMGIGIDKYDGKYEVVYEMVDPQKRSEEGLDQPIVVKSVGTTLEGAFLKLNQSLTKEPTLSHVPVVFFGENIALEGMDEALTYLTLNPRIHPTFYPALIKGPMTHFFDLEESFCSTQVQEQIDFNENSLLVASKQTFREFYDVFLDKRKDATINVVERENRSCKITGLGAFQGNQWSFYLNNQETNLIQLFNGSLGHFPLEFDYSFQDSLLIDVSLKKKPTLSFDSDTVFIHLDMDDSLPVEQSFPIQKIWGQKILAFIQKLQLHKTDLLGIQKRFFQRNRFDLEDWTKQNIKVIINDREVRIP